jgi:benzoyl-CoA reductase/2-hydroxyglutaryl-CoA dehydratase subunit BcrC/BadD/HgdB
MSRLRCQDAMKDVLRDYFTGMKSPLAWCTSAGPAEILRALGFEVYFPENHGAMLGASRLAAKYIPRANNIGYSADICSYLTSDIGAWLARETPLTAAYGLPSIPKPDLIVFNTNQCREVAEWFHYFGREFDCPAIGIYPPRHLESVTDEAVANVVAQFEELIAVGEKIIGHKLDAKKLARTVQISREASDLWKRLLNMARAHPAPLTFFDGTILMAPIVVLRGTQVAVDFYRAAVEEMEALSTQKAAAVSDETVRIYWEGMPIWGRLRALSDLFSENRAAVVASTYCNSWIFDDFDANNPLPSLARAYTQIFINRGEHAKLDYLAHMVEDFKIDGMIFHDAKTCFNNSNNRFALPQRLGERCGIPTLTLDGDLNDLRFFPESRARTNIETFVVQLVSARTARKRDRKGELQ